MYKPEEIEGKKFGYLTAIKYSGNGKWECACDCGNIKYVETSKLVKGKIVSCGCKNKLHQFRKTHGMTNTRIYSIWSGMKNRCQNTRKQEYKMYGGRGISICDEWLGENGFEYFCDWAMQNGYQDNLTIERKDVDGNYCPENCCWIPLGEQALNTRNNVYLEYNGESKPISQWAKEYGINYQVFHNRVRNLGWSMEKALNEPVRTY